MHTKKIFFHSNEATNTIKFIKIYKINIPSHRNSQKSNSSEAQPADPSLLPPRRPVNAPENSEEDGLVAGDAQLRALAELVHLVGQVQQRPEQWVAENRHMNHEPLAVISYVHHQVPLGHVLRDLLRLRLRQRQKIPVAVLARQPPEPLLQHLGSIENWREMRPRLTLQGLCVCLWAYIVGLGGS